MFICAMFGVLGVSKMDSKIGFQMRLFDRCRGNTWTMCEFHGSNDNGLGDIWWTDKPCYFSIIDSGCR